MNQETRPIFYRYETNPPMQVGAQNMPPIECEEYVGVRKTNKGWWIKLRRYADYSQSKKRWISNSSKKRWAYPTKEQAWESLVIRKRRRQEYLEEQLERAKLDNAIIEECENDGWHRT